MPIQLKVTFHGNVRQHAMGAPLPAEARRCRCRRHSPPPLTALLHKCFTALQVQGDPRRPAEVRPFNRPKLNMDEVWWRLGLCVRPGSSRRGGLHPCWTISWLPAIALATCCRFLCHAAQMPPDMFLICGLALGLISLVFKVSAASHNVQRATGPAAAERLEQHKCESSLHALQPQRCKLLPTLLPSYLLLAMPPACNLTCRCLPKTPCLQAKVCAWGSLLLCLCGVASAKTGQSDLKQIVSSITFACFGLFSCYLQPLRERLPPAVQ